MADKYVVTSGLVTSYHHSLRDAVKKTIEHEKKPLKDPNCCHWQLYDRNSSAFIYLRLGTVTRMTSDDQGANKEDIRLLSFYKQTRKDVERFNDVMFLGTSEEIKKKQGIENTEDFRFFIFSRDNKVRECNSKEPNRPFTDWVAWFRNRSPNRTKRGVRLFFNKKKDNMNNVFISTVFMGAVPKKSIEGYEGKNLPPLFESFVCFPEEGIEQVYRYECFKDAEEGHRALAAVSPEELMQHILDEQAEKIMTNDPNPNYQLVKAD